MTSPATADRPFEGRGTGRDCAGGRRARRAGRRPGVWRPGVWRLGVWRPGVWRLGRWARGGQGVHGSRDGAWWRSGWARLRVAGDAGMATAEYAIATIAAAGFAGLLVVVLRSDEVRGLLTGLVRTALSM